MKGIIFTETSEEIYAETWFDVVTKFRTSSWFHEPTNIMYMLRIARQMKAFDGKRIATHGEWAFLCSLERAGYITMVWEGREENDADTSTSPSGSLFR